LRRIKQGFGILALTALAAASIGAGPASAATHRVAGTKAAWQATIARVPQPGNGCYRAAYPSLKWQATKCVTAPRIPFAPALPRGSASHPGPAKVGDGHDYSAEVTGLISKAVGTFTDVSSNITEKGKLGNEGSKVANGFSLQLNTQFISGSPACDGASDPSNCLAWQQFIYAYEGCSVSCIFMQYWLINYDATCPSGWTAYSTDCYTNSNAAEVGTVTAKDLATTVLTASAKSGAKDSVSLAVGAGTATTVSGKDSKIDLAKFWNTTEWGVFGDGGGGEAYFSADATLEAQTALTATSTSAPTCVSEGFTGETNNLNLTTTPALGSEPSPTMASRQTDGTTGTPSCAVAA
jgi:hypothetical protein